MKRVIALAAAAVLGACTVTQGQNGAVGVRGSLADLVGGAAEPVRQPAAGPVSGGVDGVYVPDTAELESGEMTVRTDRSGVTRFKLGGGSRGGACGVEGKGKLRNGVLVWNEKRSGDGTGVRIAFADGRAEVAEESHYWCGAAVGMTGVWRKVR